RVARDPVGVGEDQTVRGHNEGAGHAGYPVDEAVDQPVELPTVVGVGHGPSSPGGVSMSTGGEAAAAARPARLLAWERGSAEPGGGPGREAGGGGAPRCARAAARFARDARHRGPRLRAGSPVGGGGATSGGRGPVVAGG